MRNPRPRRPHHQQVAYLPEIRCYLLRNARTGRLELWMKCRTGNLPTGSIQWAGVDVALIQEVLHAYRVIDTDRNRAADPDKIGTIYLDTPPNRLDVKEL